ncbi:acyl-ACP--UDP-N-acetylglucosamine O-acyltransferase [Legionella hackeliae]|uniref:Acyl-[acyl-carrier-protein]--UDP-N-acetylglucosamine O-acyltransferase n=1 Tax=Legionella hackeliae TaxID=449 RepID=A0A0A8UTX9_LEGHA|nr:acyl-ACP--UDP-N-acetylglucosamine O-acyltransferase [Legionella hackeliae]KTD12732.1 UDP-N-acetylglucosamine acyltransferase [Legionella hackeliae]CEK12153.1 Acyl-[acyl-carrier-protein]--UDP-N-acetylglucosamine O-acyltransferase [Legionella hackeliae]STX48940.1 UDP-N-acetylglucosamine acyltransferase [Legionella hackeliae]
MLMSQLEHSANLIPALDQIHPTVLIAPGAKIGPGVSIGPYSIIGENVSIARGTSIASHVTIEGWTEIGERNQIGIGSIIGGRPQDLKFNGEISKVFIGNDNVIREYVTINRGTRGGGGITRIGDNNIIMTSAHVGHDVLIGNHNIISNAVAIGGHVVIEDRVTIGALSGLHQFVKLGRMSMIGALSLITKDVCPYALVTGNPAKLYGINVERLRRQEYSTEAKSCIKRAYKILFYKGLRSTDAIMQLQAEFKDNVDINFIIDFLKGSTRGFYR